MKNNKVVTYAKVLDAVLRYIENATYAEYQKEGTRARNFIRVKLDQFYYLLSKENKNKLTEYLCRLGCLCTPTNYEFKVQVGKIYFKHNSIGIVDAIALSDRTVAELDSTDVIMNYIDMKKDARVNLDQLAFDRKYLVNAKVIDQNDNIIADFPSQTIFARHGYLRCLVDHTYREFIDHSIFKPYNIARGVTSHRKKTAIQSLKLLNYIRRYYISSNQCFLDEIEIIIDPIVFKPSVQFYVDKVLYYNFGMGLTHCRDGKYYLYHTPSKYNTSFDNYFNIYKFMNTKLYYDYNSDHFEEELVMSEEYETMFRNIETSDDNINLKEDIVTNEFKNPEVKVTFEEYLSSLPEKEDKDFSAKTSVNNNINAFEIPTAKSVKNISESCNFVLAERLFLKEKILCAANMGCQWIQIQTLSYPNKEYLSKLGYKLEMGSYNITISWAK